MLINQERLGCSGMHITTHQPLGGRYGLADSARLNLLQGPFRLPPAFLFPMYECWTMT
jgi:hypothetical protein